MSRPRLSLTKLWMRTFCFVLCRVSMMASATLTSGARMTPMPWVPSSSLMTTGAPPTRSIAGMHVGAVAHERRRRHADVVPGQDLGRAQLVAGVGDAVRGVGRVDVHLLELAHDGGAEVGDRVADARQHRVVVGQRLAPELQVRLVARRGRCAKRRVLSTLTSWPRSRAAVRRRCVEYDRGARERIASFIVAPARDGCEWIGGATHLKPPIVGMARVGEPPRRRRAVDQGQDRHRGAVLVDARLRHGGARARRRARGCGSPSTRGSAPTRTPSRSRARSTTGASCAARRATPRSGIVVLIDVAPRRPDRHGRGHPEQPRRDGLPDARRPRGAAPGVRRRLRPLLPRRPAAACRTPAQPRRLTARRQLGAHGAGPRRRTG